MSLGNVSSVTGRRLSTLNTENESIQIWHMGKIYQYQYYLAQIDQSHKAEIFLRFILDVRMNREDKDEEKKIIITNFMLLYCLKDYIGMFFFDYK